MKNILHITTHMGGGVGKVLSGISTYANKYSDRYKHKIILLEKPQKMNFIDICCESGVEIKICDDFEQVYEEIEAADIVQIEWWNHPKMSEFMASFPEINTRVVIWAHISGCTYPNIPFEFIKIPSKFLFTSECSYENPMWNKLEREYVKKNTKVINSSGGFEKLKGKKLKRHEGFNIGYIGTLNYSKLNEKFYEYYQSIDIKDVKFTIVGDIENSNEIVKDLKKSNLYNKTIINGYVDDVGKEMETFDVFSYLLNKDHFGTTENILLEAMAMELPVVAINQCAEKFIIKHMETGILVETVEEYKQAINYLYNNPKEANAMGAKAKEFVLNKFSVENTVNNLHMIYSEILNEDKKIYNFREVLGEKPYEWFLKFLGEYEKIFDKMSKNIEKTQKNERLKINLRILKEKNKSSIYQFLKYYPEDEILKYWSDIIE